MAVNVVIIFLNLNKDVNMPENTKQIITFTVNTILTKLITESYLDN